MPAHQGDPKTDQKTGVSDGTRTRDILDHNQVLYQLSYTHHALTSPAALTMVAGRVPVTDGVSVP